MIRDLEGIDCVVITGAFGYLGGEVLSHLEGSFTRPIFLLEPRTKNKASHALKDYSVLSLERICKLVSERKVLVLHFATDYGYSSNDVKTVESNLLHPLTILQHMSSGSVFVNSDTVLPKWVNSYALSKSQFNEWLKLYSKNVEYINLAIEHFFGPHDDQTKFVPRMLNMMIDGANEILLTPGAQKRDFIYIDDLLSAIRCVLYNINRLIQERRYEIQISYGKPISVREFLEIAAGILEYDTSRLKFGAYPYRANEVFDLSVDTSILLELGWCPKVTREEGVVHYRDYRRRSTSN